MLLVLLGKVSRAIALERNGATGIEENIAIGIEENDTIADELLFDGTAAAEETLPEADMATDSKTIGDGMEGKIIAIDMPLAEVAIEQKVAAIPDITQLTLDSFELVDSKESAADILTLGDLSKILDLRNMTVGAALAGRHRHELQTLTLDRYDFLAEMTISEVADMAGLYSKTVGEVPIVETAILTFLNHPVLIRERKVTLSRFLSQYPEIGSIKLGLLELPEYHYSAIPKLLAVPITSISNWQQLKVSSIVGLRDLPIHQNLQIDGEIVTLSTARMGERTEIQLLQDAGISATWSENLDENAFQPFGSFLLKPAISGETIRIDAYFQSCASDLTTCEFIGPFAYLDYKVGDRFYVSQADWQSVVVQEKTSIEFKRKPAPVVEEPTTFFDSELLKAIVVGTSVVIAGGASALLWFLSKYRKEARS